MRNNSARCVALGGVLAALALVLLCLGGLIPLATFVCPVLCTMTAQCVLRLCGRRIAWAWYGAVAFLGLLLGPDKEAAAVFVLLGCYPMLKCRFEALVLPILWKMLYFNGAVLTLYALSLHLLGLHAAIAEYKALGAFGLIAALLLGNVTFLLLDRLLSLRPKRK